MKISDFISKLEALKKQMGDVEVTITDGHDMLFYRGSFEITPFEEKPGQFLVDIGVGGCREETED